MFKIERKIVEFVERNVNILFMLEEILFPVI